MAYLSGALNTLIPTRSTRAGGLSASCTLHFRCRRPCCEQRSTIILHTIAARCPWPPSIRSAACALTGSCRIRLHLHMELCVVRDTGRHTVRDREDKDTVLPLVCPAITKVLAVSILLYCEGRGIGKARVSGNEA